MQFLEQRVYVATVPGSHSTPPIIGIPLTATDRVTVAVDKLFAGDARAIKKTGADHVTWKIMPLDDEYGIRQPFVISIRSNVFFIASNAAVLDQLFDHSGPTRANFAPPDTTLANLAWRVDLQKWAGEVFRQLGAKQFSKQTESILARLDLRNSILAADPTKLPPFEEVRANFDSVFYLIGQRQNGHWTLELESREN